MCRDPEEESAQVCPIWVRPTDAALAGPVIISADGSVLFAGTRAGSVYAIDAATGAVLWQGATGSPATEAPALVGTSLFVPTADGDLDVFAAPGCGTDLCSPTWTGSTGSGISTQPGATDDVVFTGSVDGTVAAFPVVGCGAPTCPPMWTDSAGSRINGDPAISGGQLYVGTDDGRLIAYAPPA